MNEFKEKIMNLIIDLTSQEINYENLTTIYNWPEITFYDEEDEDNNNSEALDIENCSILSITDEYMEVIAGGDWQQPHIVRIEDINGELAVTSCKSHEFYSGMEYDEIIKELEN